MANSQQFINGVAPNVPAVHVSNVGNDPRPSPLVAINPRSPGILSPLLLISPKFSSESLTSPTSITESMPRRGPTIPTPVVLTRAQRRLKQGSNHIVRRAQSAPPIGEIIDPVPPLITNGWCGEPYGAGTPGFTPPSAKPVRIPLYSPFIVLIARKPETRVEMETKERIDRGVNGEEPRRVITLPRDTDVVRRRKNVFTSCVHTRNNRKEGRRRFFTHEEVVDIEDSLMSPNAQIVYDERRIFGKEGDSDDEADEMLYDAVDSHRLFDMLLSPRFLHGLSNDRDAWLEKLSSSVKTMLSETPALPVALVPIAPSAPSVPSAPSDAIAV